MENLLQHRFMKFEIRTAQNGVILKIDHGDSEADPEEVVYQEQDGNEIEAFADFLRCLDDNYGPQTSRYSPKRIVIRVEPGDKYEEPET